MADRLGGSSGDGNVDPVASRLQLGVIDQAEDIIQIAVGNISQLKPLAQFAAVDAVKPLVYQLVKCNSVSHPQLIGSKALVALQIGKFEHLTQPGPLPTVVHRYVHKSAVAGYVRAIRGDHAVVEAGPWGL